MALGRNVEMPHSWLSEVSRSGHAEPRRTSSARFGESRASDGGRLVYVDSRVHEDNVKDTLTGGNGAGNTDWYFRNSLGAVVAQRDTVNDTDLDSAFTEIDTWA